MYACTHIHTLIHTCVHIHTQHTQIGSTHYTCTHMYTRDGTIQGAGVSMHHAKSITIHHCLLNRLEYFYNQYTKAMK